ncbi:unnamed protein product [Aphanomyces euteiches]
MSSDEEFERFLEGDSDDEKSAFTKTLKKAKKKTSKKASKTKEAKTPAIDLDDSADPYNFDMNPPRSSSDDDEKEQLQVKKDKKKEKENRTKEAPKKQSLEDRMAEILKRHGSALAETFAKPQEELSVVPDIKELPKDDEIEVKEAKQEEDASEKSDSYSDSLGMESADFEVGGYAKKTASEKAPTSTPVESKKAPTSSQIESIESSFTLNKTAIEQAPPAAEGFRYASNKSYALENESDDDELIQTSHVKESVLSPPQTNLVPQKADAPFKSDFEKMKELFSLPTELDKADESAYDEDDFEEEHAAPTSDVKSTQKIGPDMYDDDEFEDSDQPPPSPPPSPPPPPPLDLEVISPPMSPGPPPPPPDFELPPSTNLDPAEKSSLPNPETTITSDLKTSMSFLDESFEFNYDLRSKVETIEPPSSNTKHDRTDDVPISAVHEDKNEIVTSTFISKDEGMPYSRSEGSVTVAPKTSQQEFGGADMEGPNPTRIQEVAPFAIQDVSTTSEGNYKMQQGPPPVATRTSIHLNLESHESAAQNPIIAKFHSLQNQLNRSSIGPSESSDSFAQAFERDKYIIRAFSNKENEMKLQLQAAQREILGLRHQVEALSTEQEVHTLSDARLLGKYVQPTSGVQMTNQAWDSMRKEIETQEALIQGYQVENERLMRQLKEVKRDLQYDVHLNNQQLQATIKDLKHQLDTAPSVSSWNLEAQLRADARILSLEEDLHRLQEDRALREKELKQELESVKKAKIDLECRIAGVHMETLHAENEAYESLKARSEAQLREAQDKILSLESKLEWYIQNQRFIDEQDALVKQQQQTISDLKEQLESKPKRMGNKMHRAPADIRRIQALEAQLKEMETAMRKRHPDSLVNLILASKPSPNESKANEQAQLEIQRLKTQIQEMERAHEVKLTKFRQQHERVIQELKEASKPKAQSETTDEGRIRAFYQNKIKELEKKLESLKPPSSESRADKAKIEMEAMEQRHRQREAALQLQLDESENARRMLIEAINSSASNETQVIQPPKMQPAILESLPPPPPLPSSLGDSKLENEVTKLQELMQELKQTHEKAMVDAKALWQDEFLHLSDRFTKAQLEAQTYAQIAARVPHLEEKIQSLTRQLEIPNTPSMLQYQALDMQIQTLQQKHALREAELKVLLQQATQSSKVEVLKLQQQHERAMTTKNEEIRSFQAQVHDI